MLGTPIGNLGCISLAAASALMLTSCAREYEPPQGYVYGTVGGVSIRVPEDEVFLWDRVEKASSVPEGPAGCTHKIHGGTLFLRWPGLVARNAENNDEFERTYWKSLGPTPWMDIGFGDWNNPGGMAIAKIARGELIEDVNRSYEEVAFASDKIYGLDHGYKVGEYPNSYSEINAYWDGDLTGLGQVKTYITCGNALKIRPAGRLRRCEHRVMLDEMGMMVSIRYRENLLPQWRAIQDSVSQHFLSFRHTCE